MITAEQIEEHNARCEETKKRLDPGPWQSEPNRVEFKAHGLPCLLVRNPEMGHWCGYVGVPKTHPFHGMSHHDDALMNVPAHGGLTYSDECHQFIYDALLNAPAHGGLTYSDECHQFICHVTEGTDSTWWFGFDCAHSGDLTPSLKSVGKLLPNFKVPSFFTEGTYRDVAWVLKETYDLALTLSKVHP